MMGDATYGDDGGMIQYKISSLEKQVIELQRKFSSFDAQAQSHHIMFQNVIKNQNS